MTLSQTAIIIKQVITISIIVIITSLAGFIGYKVWHAYYLAHLPPVEEKPDTKFGLLPLPDFDKSTVSSSNYSYSIDTVTGGLPKVGKDPGFEKLIKVYFVTKTFATLLSPERSQNLAEKLGIIGAPHILSEIKYRFEDKNKALNVDLDTGNFTYEKTATPSGQPLDEDVKLVSDFQDMLKNLSIFKPDLAIGRNKVIHLNSGGAQISLWPASLDNKPILTPLYNKSLVNARVISSADNIENYLSLNLTYYPIDTTTFATYPVKSSEQSLEDLKSGKGSVVLEPDKPQVSITSVYLGYFLEEKYSPYLLPIFVFEGPNFAAYVPAITEQFQTQPI